MYVCYEPPAWGAFLLLINDIRYLTSLLDMRTPCLPPASFIPLRLRQIL